jgi:hypothetical protein
VRRFRVFLASEMATECEVCGVRFDLMKGGVCAACGRVLCATHLHGSYLQRLRVDLGATPRCVQCRAAGRG